MGIVDLQSQWGFGSSDGFYLGPNNSVGCKVSFSKSLPIYGFWLRIHSGDDSIRHPGTHKAYCYVDHLEGGTTTVVDKVGIEQTFNSLSFSSGWYWIYIDFGNGPWYPTPGVEYWVAVKGGATNYQYLHFHKDWSDGQRTASFPDGTVVTFYASYGTNHPGSWRAAGTSWGFRAFVNSSPNAPNLFTPGHQSNTNDNTPTFSWGFSDPDAGNYQTAFQIQVSTDPNFGYVNGFDTGWVYSGAQSYTHPSPLWDAVWYYRIRTKDQDGYESPWSWVPWFRVDTQAPSSGGGTPSPQYANVPVGGTFRVQVTGVGDSGSGVTNVRFPTWTDANGQDDIRWYDGVNAGGGTWYVDVPIANHGNAEGKYITHVYAYDAAGNNQVIRVVDTYVDRTAPTGSITINGGAAKMSGTTQTVTLTLSASDNIGVSQMRIANSADFSGAVWETYVSSKSWTVTSGTGTKAVYVQYRDLAGNISATYSDSIYRNALPTASITNLVNNAGYLITQRPRITVSTSDLDGDAITSLHIQFSNNSNFSPLVHEANFTGTSYTPTADIGTGTKYVRVRAFDGTDYSDWSPTVQFNIQAPGWTGTISDTDTGVRKVWIDELRTKINAVRQARGLATKTWTDATITANTSKVRAVHLIELRTAIQELFDALGLGTIAWTDPTITADVTERKGKHWNELRQKLEQC